MRILFLTQYYPPEIGAPQNRLHGLARHLSAQGVEVEVLTSMPSYPAGVVQGEYKGKWFFKETIDGISVHRARSYVTSSKGIVKRLVNYFSFVFSSLIYGLFAMRKSDVIFCESPPLFLGITAYILRLFKAKHMVMNISDLWPESAEKLGLVSNKSLLGLATGLEEFLYRRSSLISGQTQGIVDDIKRRITNRPVHWLPNGVDVDLFDPGIIDSSTWRMENGFKADDLLFYYGGIIGHAQGLEIILQAAAQLKREAHLHFILMGNGPEKEKCMALKKELGVQRVHFLPPVSRAQMPRVLSAIDTVIVPLKKLPLFEGAIPSKIFEALAMEKSMLLGVNGEAKRHFVESAEAAIHFEPENVDALVKGIRHYAANPELRTSHGKSGREYVVSHFLREDIASRLVEVMEKELN